VAADGGAGAALGATILLLAALRFHKRLD